MPSRFINLASQTNIAPRELMTEIKSAFKAQLVDTSIIRLDDVVDAAQNSEPWSWLSEYSRLGIADCLKELEGWAAFDDTPKKSNPTSSPSTARPSSAVQPGVRVIDLGEQSRTGRPGRNDPCPCASGLKYKKCCGK